MPLRVGVFLDEREIHAPQYLRKSLGLWFDSMMTESYHVGNPISSRKQRLVRASGHQISCIYPPTDDGISPDSLIHVDVSICVTPFTHSQPLLGKMGRKWSKRSSSINKDNSKLFLYPDKNVLVRDGV